MESELPFLSHFREDDPKTASLFANRSDSLFEQSRKMKGSLSFERQNSRASMTETFLETSLKPMTKLMQTLMWFLPCNIFAI
jgi:hypothetical protein